MKSHAKSIFGLLLLAGGIALLALAANHASAATLTVDDDGNGNYTKIQDAIDNATDGDTIRVFDGTYYENVVVNKTVSLIGNGSANTTIDGGGSGTVVKITVDWVNISGFMVTGSGSWDVEIKVESNSNTIMNNTCSNNYYGIYLRNSENNTLTNNTCSNNYYGIYLERSDSNILTNNTCSYNDWYGIYLYGSDSNTLTYNTCSDNEYGIYLPGSGHNTLTNNTCSDNDYGGIYLASSDHNTLTGNLMWEDGIVIYGSGLEYWNTHVIDATNTVNGRPVRYYKNETGLTVPSGAGQVILANCTEMVVENQNLSDGSVGIQLGFSSNVIISNNTCSYNNYGIYLSDSDGNTLTNNTCSNNNYGIYLSHSENNTLTNNTCSYNHYGIYLSYSENNTLTNNTCSYNDRYGIYLYYYSNSNSLLNNTCSNNSYGIYIYSSSNHNTISNNTISGNIEGIRLKDSSEGNVAHYNNIYSNTEYGINATENNGCTINATNNWWGDPSGPYHPVNNTEGKGDNVTDYVEFEPWLVKKPENRKPIITTTDTTQTYEDEEYSVDYEAEDKDEDPLTWSLTTNATFLAINSTTGLLNGTPENKDIGNYWVNVSVSDGELLDYHNFTLEIINVNDRPKMTTDDMAECLEDTEYLVDYNATDEDKDELRWSLQTNATFLTINSIIGFLTGTPAQKDVGTYWVNVTVSDGELIDYHNFTLTVIEVNEKPIITTTDKTQTLEDEEYSVYYEAADEENDTLTWSLTTNASFLTINPTTGELTGTPQQKDVGTYWVNVTASDSELIDYHNFTLTIIEVNEKPIITTTDKTTCNEDEEYYVDYLASDEENDTLTWSLTTNATFLTINPATGELTGTPQQKDVGTYWVNVTASDGELIDYHNFTLTVIEVNEKPIITTTYTTTATEDKEYSIHYTATDEENDILTWSLTTNASFLTIDSSTGILNGTPENDDVGSYRVNISVSDGKLIDYHNFTLEVINVNDPPTFTITSPVNNSKVSGTVTISGTASDEDGTVEKVEISIKGGPWLPATGTESWSLEWDTEDLKNGEYTIKVRSYDGKNYSQEKSLTVRVENKENGGGGGFIPGFKAITLVGVVTLSAVVLAWRKRS